MSIFFKDLAKKANDLLGNKKHYTTDGNKKFSIKTKTADGITYSAESTVDGTNVNGKIKCEFQSDCGCMLNFKKLSMDTNGVFESELVIDKALDNVRFTISSNKCKPFSSADGKKCEGSLGVEYDHNDFKAKFDASPWCKNTANASICFKKDNIVVGGSVGVTGITDNFGLGSYDFGLGYTCAENKNIVALNVCDLSAFKLSFYNQHSADIALAGAIATSLGEAECKCPSFEFGGSYQVDSDTTVYGKLTAPNFSAKDLTASFNMDHNLNANASLSITTVVDLDVQHVQNFFGSELGISLKFGA